MIDYFCDPYRIGQHYSHEFFYVLVSYAVSTPTVARVQPHVSWRSPHLALRVIVRTMLLLALRCAVTLMDFVVVWVVFFLLPAVAVNTAIFEVAAIGIDPCFFLSGPKVALLPGRILVDVRLAAEVLPVVGVLTFITHMTPHLVVEGAPDSLEVEHVKVIVLLHFMKKVNRQLFFEVSEGT